MSNPSVELTVGETQKLTATIVPKEATNKKVKWKSENPTYATVDQEGLVTAKAEGSTNINAITEDGNKKATCVVTVTSAASALLNKFK